MRAALVLAVLACPVWAEAPDTSPRPMPRPAVEVAMATSEQPAPRPQNGAASEPESAAAKIARIAVVAALQPAPAPPVAGLVSSPRPQPRPKVVPVAEAPQEDEAPARTSGYVCGDKDIIGVQLADIGSPTQAATMDCNTALALKRWINEGVRPAFGRDKVVGFQVAAHYICRSRNNVRGARISEHGRGKAIDISGFIMESGKVLTVVSNFNKQMRAAHKAACGIFGTTLGPGSDGYHEDHLHLDTANHGNGPYCR
jgi:hypothetical protein